TGTEALTDNMSAVNRIFNFSEPGAETIVMQNSGANLFIDSTAGVATTFAKPVDSLTVNLGGGVDTLNLTTSSITGNFTVTGTGGDDLVNFNGAVSLTAGTSTPGSASVTGVQNIAFNGGSLTAAATATLTSGTTLQSISPAVDVTAQTLIASAPGIV